MKDMTKLNLEAAFAGESQAYMKYSIFADVAEKENLPDVARLFRAIAYAEKVHATNHLKALGKVKTTSENLTSAANGEGYEIEEMYPAFMAVAQLQGEKLAEKMMWYAVEAEKIHEDMYKEAFDKVTKGEEIKYAKIWVCPLCGHTHIGDEAPDSCPVCKVGKDRYISF